MKEKNGYGQYCPIAITSEILCNRWTTLVLRAFFMGATRFSDIQRSVPLMSSALLVTRLKELEYAGIIKRTKSDKVGAQYFLTVAGQALFPVLEQMGIWAQDRLRREITRKENLDPDILMWELRRISLNSLNDENTMRKVAKFQLSGVHSSKQNYWLVFDQTDTEICVKDPGYEIDIWITSHIRTLVEIWLGHSNIREKQDTGELILDGSPSEITRFSKWFSGSHFAQFA